MSLVRGTVALVELDPTAGHEQRGVRPCVIVSDPQVSADQRFPLIAVVPVTSTPGEGALYPPLARGSGGLYRESWALADQLRSVDKRRVRRLFGTLSGAELASIDDAMSLFLGLGT